MKLRSCDLQIQLSLAWPIRRTFSLRAISKDFGRKPLGVRNGLDVIAAVVIRDVSDELLLMK